MNTKANGAVRLAMARCDPASTPNVETLLVKKSFLQHKIMIKKTRVKNLQAAPIKSNKEKTQANRIKIDGSQTRWIVISLVVYFFLAEGFTKTCFGQVNNIVARFFNVSLEVADWATITPSASSAVSLFFMTWLTASGLVGLRTWCLTSVGFVTLAFVLIVAAALCGRFFFMVILGQIFSGAANAINFSLAPLMAASWFPESEQPTAIALTYAGMNAGNIIGFLVPAHILPKLASTEAIVSSIGRAGNYHGVRIQPKAVKWSTQVSISLTSIFSSFLAASVLFGFFSFLFIFDSPSPMQAVHYPDEETSPDRFYGVTDGNNLGRHESAFHVQFRRAKDVTRTTFTAWFKTSKSLLTMKKFMVLAIPYSVLMPLCLLWFVLMSDMLRSSTFKSLSFQDAENGRHTNATYAPSSNEIAGYVMSAYCVGGLLAGTLTGKAARLFQFHYACIACGAAWGVVLASVGVYVGFMAESIETVFVFMFLFGVCAPLASTALVVLVIEHIIDEDRLTVGAWLAILSSISACLLPLFGRLLFANFGPTSLHALQISLTGAAAFFLIFVKRFLR